MEEWLSLAKSGSGERGIFNRGSLKSQFPKRRKTRGHAFGTNPCGEIILRHKQFCNLSIAVIRPEDTYEEIEEKVITATVWGTLQSTMTNFNYIGKDWTTNSEEERLLGVDLLGFLDHPLFQDNAEAAVVCEKLRKTVNEVNAQWADMLGINASAATTCIKPSGDSSVFFDTAAGFKGHHGRHYVRRVRANSTNPVAQMLKDEGVPCFTDYDGSGLVLEFPMKAPESGVLLETQTAISQLEKWKTIKKHWTEHNPSVTIYVRPEEWLEVGTWVYDNWDIVGGLSFLPYDGGIYHLAPYEAISEEDFNKRVSKFPEINWAKLTRYEKSDMTDLHQQVACTGGACEL
jgi:ribonucleoside-diphosphate reductase alpha chain